MPLIFAGPGVVQGSKSTKPAELIDMYPTLLELAGLPAKDDLEGLSLAPQLADPDAPRDRPAITNQLPRVCPRLIFGLGADDLKPHTKLDHVFTAKLPCTFTQVGNLGFDACGTIAPEQTNRGMPG